MQEISEDLENENDRNYGTIGTYWSLDSGINYRCNILTEANPQNIIEEFEFIRLGLSRRNGRG